MRYAASGVGFPGECDRRGRREAGPGEAAWPVEGGPDLKRSGHGDQQEQQDDRDERDPAHARRLADTPAPYAELASEVLCGTSCDEAARIVEAAFLSLPTDGVKPAYQIWRQRIEAQFALPERGELRSETHFVQQ